MIRNIIKNILLEELPKPVGYFPDREQARMESLWDSILFGSSRVNVPSSEYKKLYEDDKMYVIKPLSKLASCEYGVDGGFNQEKPKWGISSRTMFNNWDSQTKKTNQYAGYSWEGSNKKPLNCIPRSIPYFIIQKNNDENNPFSKVALFYYPNVSEYEGRNIENNIGVLNALNKTISIHKLYDNIPNFNEAFYYIEEDYLKEKDNIYKITGIWV